MILQSQLDRKTDTPFLQTRTDHGQTRHRGTHILSLSLSLPTRILSIRSSKPPRSTHVPQPRARTPHRRSVDSARRRRTIPPLRFTPSLGVFPMDPAVGDGSLAPSSVLESYLPPSQYGSPTGAQSDSGSAPPYSTRRVPAATGCSVAHLPPCSGSAFTLPFILLFIHSSFSPSSLLHSFTQPPTPPASAFHSFIPSFIHFPCIG